MKKVLIGFALLLALAGCNRQENAEQTTSKSTEATSEGRKETSTTQSQRISTSDNSEATTTQSTAKTEETSASSSAENEHARKLAEYNNLPEQVKVFLATTTVDDRAKYDLDPEVKPPTFIDYIQYNFDGDYLIVNLTSGIGIGHPVYLLDYDDEFIYPVDGFAIVDQSAEAVYEAAPVDPTPVSKIDLLDYYQANPQYFDASIDQILRSDNFTLHSFNENKNKIN
ncbi:lipoprotein [Enterococcus sp. AZ109]|uniref:lipoprotein n=1 Tax=Enterococcus sp. AZ109 TaxID=2774634 RepID=UPI003F281DAD